MTNSPVELYIHFYRLYRHHYCCHHLNQIVYDSMWEGKIHFGIKIKYFHRFLLFFDSSRQNFMGEYFFFCESFNKRIFCKKKVMKLLYIMIITAFTHSGQWFLFKRAHLFLCVFKYWDLCFYAITNTTKGTQLISILPTGRFK